MKQMSKIVIQIKTDSADFQYGNMEHELCRILNRLQNHIKTEYQNDKTLFDLNGNRVGFYRCFEDGDYEQ